MKATKNGRSRITPKKPCLEEIAKELANAALDGIKDLPEEEQEGRVKSFCDAASSSSASAARPRTRRTDSGSFSRDRVPMAARGRA